MENGTLGPGLTTLRLLFGEHGSPLWTFRIKSIAEIHSNQHNNHSRRIGKMHEGGTMFQRKFWWFVVLGVFTAVLSGAMAGCGGKAPALSVAVSAATSSVDGNDTTTLTATVSNDKIAGGVTWTMSGAGTMSNETTTSATFTASAPTNSSQTATITATSIADTTKSGTATITVPAMPALISTDASLAGSVGSMYSAALQASGGIPPFTWALGSGTTLPACLTLKSTGVLTTTSGTAPTASCAGSYSNLYFQFTDSGTPTPLTATSGPLTLTITAPSIAFSPVLPQGAVGTAYAGSVAATGVVGAATYSLASGALPPNVNLNASTGTIAGTPKAADVGTATFSVTVLDAYGDTATSGTMSLTIAAAPAISFGGAPAATAKFGEAYTSSVSATGGAGSLTYALASGALPPDLALSASGAIAGTPKVADIGSFTFAVKASDAYGDSATSGDYPIVVSYPAVTITPGAGSLPLAVADQSYSQSLTAAGGSGAGFTWTVTGLPANGISYTASGATLSISGPATSAGTVNFTASATDGANNSNTGGALAYSIEVYSPVTIPATIPASLPAVGTANLAYSGTVVATGGSGNYSWTVTGLSDGLASSTSGGTLTISGTPTSATTVTANVSVKDTTTNVTAGPYAYAITVYATVTLSTTNPSTLGPALVSTPYTGTIVAAGGSGDYSWTVTGLPTDNLNYSASGGTLTISGTPGSTPTTVSFTAKVTDTTTSTSSGPYNYSVTAYNAVTLDASALPTISTVNTAYTGSISASGGSGTGYTWTVTGLPADGLSYSATGGTLNITGTPTSAQAVQFTAKATDSAGNSAGPASYTVNAYSALALPATNPSTLGPATINLSYTGTIVASGGSGNYSWTVTGLPSDSLNFSASGGTLTVSGTPGTATTVSFTAKVTDTTTNVSVGPYDYSVTVYNGVMLPTPNPDTLGSADANSAYSGTIVTAGGSGNYSWTVTGLPADGLNYAASGATMTISGTPTSAQTVQFTAKVTDTSSNQTAGPFTYSILVNGQLSLPTPDPSSLPSNGYTSVNYSGSINASGGSGQYSWTVSGLPSDGLGVIGGLTGSTLTIGGTPTSATTVTFNATVKDTVTNATVTQNGYNITIDTPTPVSLPTPGSSVPGPATVNQSYNGAINATGGVSPFTWSINGTTVGSSCYSLSNGSLCATSSGGNSLMISGTPNATGTVTLTNVEVTDSLNSSATLSYSLTVSTQSTLTVTVDASQLLQGMVNMPFTFDGGLNIAGGTGPYTVTELNVPAGLSFVSAHNDDVEGTPTSDGTTTVTVNVSDSSSPVQHASTTYDLTIVPETTTTNNSRLSGQYACYLMQYWQGGATGGNGQLLMRGGAVFAFSADGNGRITGGEFDHNSPISGYRSAGDNGALGGTYAIGSDNRGYMLPSVGGDSVVLAIAGGNLDSNSHFTEFAMIEMDDAGTSPSGQYGGGHCYKQNTTTSLNGFQLSGGSVFGIKGEDINGNLESQAGYTKYTAGNLTGELDSVDAGSYKAAMSFTGTYTTADAYGRMTTTVAGNGGTSVLSVSYITNNATGETLTMAANPHNATSNAEFVIGEARAQNAVHVAVAHPYGGPFVLYMSGEDDDLSTYDAEVLQGTASFTATSVTLKADIANKGGTITTTCPNGSACPLSLTYTTDSTTGRTTINGPTGIVFYVYDTNSAVVLFGDTGGGDSHAENRLGWMEPQIAPSSGTWAVSNLAASMFMNKFIDGNPGYDLTNSTFTLATGGSILNYAEDDNGDGWAEWDEDLCAMSGGCGGTVTAALVPDSAANSTTGTLGLDPTGTLGVFDVERMLNSTTEVMTYCIAVSVDKATNSSTEARMVCLDNSSGTGSLNILQQ
jgi:hypothetical protein